MALAINNLKDKINIDRFKTIKLPKPQMIKLKRKKSIVSEQKKFILLKLEKIDFEEVELVLWKRNKCDRFGFEKSMYVKNEDLELMLEILSLKTNVLKILDYKITK